jgi:hypothetical protein
MSVYNKVTATAKHGEMAMPRRDAGRNIVEDAISNAPALRDCPACGSTVPGDASYCPECGAEQAGPVSAAEASVSRYWAYILLVGLLAWLGIFLAVGTLPETPDTRVAVGGVALATTVGLPLAGFFDLRYVRETTRWRPDTFPWLVGFTVWFLNVVVLAVYLSKRYRMSHSE